MKLLWKYLRFGDSIKWMLLRPQQQQQTAQPQTDYLRLKCVLQPKIAKEFTKNPYFWGSRSFKVIDVLTNATLVSSACYDTQKVCVYLQPFSYLPQHNSPGGVRLTALDQSRGRTGDKQQQTQYRTESDMFGLPDDHRDTSTDYGRPPDETVAVARDLSNLETSVQEVRAPRPDPPAAAEATATSVTLA